MASWTQGLTKYEVMHLLQQHGVPAGPVLMARDILTDPHLRQRGFIQWFTHPPERRVGRRPLLGQPFHLSRGRPGVRFIPGPGEHNREVLGDLLGMSDTQLQAYEAQGLIGTAPRDEELLRPRLPSLEEFLAQEQWACYDPDYRKVLNLDVPSDG